MKKGQSRRVWTPEEKAEIVHKHLDQHISVRTLEKECLGILATRKRVHEFLDAYLVGYLIFLQLVLYVGFNYFFIPSYSIDEIPSGPEMPVSVLVF